MDDLILVPTDGSDHARWAAEYGGALARAFDATLHVVNVVDTQAAGGPFNAGGLGAEFVERLETDAEERIEAAVDAAGSLAETHTAVLKGRPRDEILEYADEQDVDLIAMGSRDGRVSIDTSPGASRRASSDAPRSPC